IVRRPHDVASAGGKPAARRARAGVSRLPAASGRTSVRRARPPLFDVQIPMLFLQGTRDALATLDELQPLTTALGSRATLKLFQDADHSFHVPKRSGRNDAQVLGEMLDALAAWSDDVSAGDR